MKKKIIILVWMLLGYSGLTGQNFFERHGYTIEVIPLINTSESEIVPAFVKGDLVYTAVREQMETNNRTWLRDDQFYDVFFTQTDIAGFPQILGKRVNGFGNPYHEGPVSWCEATGELFVTQSNVSASDIQRGRMPKGDVNLKLVVKKETDDRWVVVEDFPFNNPEFDVAHPAISPTGDSLIFSSTRRGGYGKSDLYLTVRNEGKWSEPQNLGQRINTAGNELFPAFGPDGLIIFSSDGHTGNLGQLDLYCIDLADDVTVLHLGNQLNSEYDDFGLIVHPSRAYGYFTSNRPGAGQDDIYLVRFNALYEQIGGIVSDFSGKPVSEVVVDLKDCNGNQLMSALSGSDGRFSFEVLKDSCYQASATKEGYNPDTKRYYLEKTVRLSVEQITSYRVLALDAETNQPIQGASVYCEDHRWVTNESGFAKIKADSVTICNLRATGDNYLDFTIETSSYQFQPGDDLVETVRLYEKKLDKSYRLRNIQFFLDKWRLLPESERELDKLVKLLNDNPTLKVEIATHTDSRGESQYNLWLSQKRSDSATDYLIENGIPKERIISQGYGESRLINHCADGVNCSEREHRENRRTEFVIRDF